MLFRVLCGRPEPLSDSFKVTYKVTPPSFVPFEYMARVSNLRDEVHRWYAAKQLGVDEQ